MVLVVVLLLAAVCAVRAGDLPPRSPVVCNGTSPSLLSRYGAVASHCGNDVGLWCQLNLYCVQGLCLGANNLPGLNQTCATRPPSTEERYCASGLYCGSNDVCVPQQPAGGACAVVPDRGSPCQGDLVCVGGRCQAVTYQQIGQPCSAAMPCAADSIVGCVTYPLVCSAAVCTALLLDRGQPCGPSLGSCRAPYTCSATTSKCAGVSSGMPCNSSAAPDPCDGFCDPATNTCAALLPGLSNCTGGSQCRPGFVCNTAAAHPSCVAVHTGTNHDGVQYSDLELCASGLLLDPTSKRCVLPNSVSCTRDTDCQDVSSFQCDCLNGTCQAVRRVGDPACAALEQRFDFVQDVLPADDVGFECFGYPYFEDLECCMNVDSMMYDQSSPLPVCPPSSGISQKVRTITSSYYWNSAYHVPAVSAVVANDLLWFLGEDAAFGRELWVSDGTPTGTYRVTDVAPGLANSNPHLLSPGHGVSSNLLFFVASQNGAEPGPLGFTGACELYAVDTSNPNGTVTLVASLGTAGGQAGIAPVSDGSVLFFVPSPSDPTLWQLTRYNGSSVSPLGSPVTRPTLVVSSGTGDLMVFAFGRPGNVTVSVVQPPYVGVSVFQQLPDSVTAVADVVFCAGFVFLHVNATDMAHPLWAGAPGGGALPVQFVFDQNGLPDNVPVMVMHMKCDQFVVGQPQSLVILASAVVAGVQRPATLFRVYQTDGATAVRVLSQAYAADTTIADFALLDGGIIYAGRDARGTEPWVTGGSDLVPRQIADLTFREGDSDPNLFSRVSEPGALVSSGVLFFAATGNPPVTGVLRTDGTAAGTKMIAPLSELRGGFFVLRHSGRILTFSEVADNPPNSSWEVPSVGGVDLIMIAGCGDGVLQPGEECDGGGCCDQSCNLHAPGTVCRVATGGCDVEERCLAGTSRCPNNVLQPTGTPCQPSVGGKTPEAVCMGPTVCSGTSVVCPNAGPVLTGQSCGGFGSSAPCVAASVCSADSFLCPGAPVDSGSSCTLAGCDGDAGQCDGSTPLCSSCAPASEGAKAGTVGVVLGTLLGILAAVGIGVALHMYLKQRREAPVRGSVNSGALLDRGSFEEDEDYRMMD